MGQRTYRTLADFLTHGTVRPEDADEPGLGGGRTGLSGIDPGRSVQVGQLIGQGGMAKVFLGEQASLGRQVAVKVPLASAGTWQTDAMVTEGLVTSRLQHPGIVPIHTLEVDDDGVPKLVLKLIEGQTWSELLDDLPAGGCPSDQLPEHLRIWLRVAEAIGFAHARGVIHRDIKPDNVMVGSHGEVYVLDWGVAVAWRPDADPVVPRLTERNRVAGTPHFMAPEQSTRHGEPQGPTTDVFLMAATLYAVLAGRPPHLGSSLTDVLREAAICQASPLPDHVDPGLAGICLAALAREPTRRPPTVAELARSVQHWLDQRPARRVLADLDRRASAFEQDLARPLDELTTELDELLVALAPLGAVLDEGDLAPVRSRAVVAVARAALAQDSLPTLERMLALPGVLLDDEVRARLETGRERLRTRDRYLREHARRYDLTTGRSRRWLTVAGLGAVSVVGTVIVAVQGATPPLGETAVINAIFGSVVIAVLVVGRRAFFATIPNRVAVVAVAIATFGLVALDLWGMANGIDAQAVYVLHLLMLTIASAVYGVGAEPRAWPAPLPMAAALFGAVLSPEHHAWWATVGIIGSVGVIAEVSLRAGAAEASEAIRG